MTQTDPSARQTGSADAGSRRASGIALIVGAIVIVALIETETLAYYWFPTLVGLTYLAAAVAGRSQSSLWAPGLIVTSVGLAAAVWLRDGRPADSFQFLALATMALGLGGVLAALLAQSTGVQVTAMGVAVPVLLFGAFALLEQQAIAPFAGQSWAYAGLLALYGAFELRPDRRG